MPPETPMERLEAMAVDREVEAETIRGNKFRSHAYALEHELAASDLRWALAEITRLTADCARKDALIADYEKPGGWTWLREREARRVLGDPMQGVSLSAEPVPFTNAAASARGEGSGR